MSLSSGIVPVSSSYFFNPSKLYTDYAEVIGRVAAVASPVLLRIAPASIPVGLTLSAMHSMTLFRLGSYEGYVLSVLTVASFGFAVFNPLLASALFLVQSLVTDLSSARHHLKEGVVWYSVHDLANATCTMLKLILHRRYSIDLNIAATVIRLSSDLYKMALEAKACSEGDNRLIELIGSSMMIAVGSCSLYQNIEEKKLWIRNSIMTEFDARRIDQGKYSTDQLTEIKRALSTDPENHMRVVTYNMLFDLFDEELIGSEQVHSWKNRLSRIVKSIENMNPDILNVQETYPAQIQDLNRSLQDRYTLFTGGHEKGEMNAIFYRTDRFEKIESGSYAFRMTLDQRDEARISKFPDHLPSDLEPGTWGTVVQLINKITGKCFAVINTHLTFRRMDSRQTQARDLISRVEQYQKQGIPVVLTGDLNTFPNRPDWKLPFYDGERVERIFKERMQDAQEVSLLGSMGANTTGVARNFNSCDHASLFEQVMHGPRVIMDHIYVSGMKVLSHAVEAARVGGYLPSDHMPVVADIVL